MKKTVIRKSAPDLTKQPNFSPARSVVWMNIAMQVVFPLSLSFTPAMAELSTPPEMTSNRYGEMKTVNYRLKAGESVYTVATRYGLSYSALMQLNHGRHFARGFRAASEGDEITVPEKVPDDSEKTAQYLASTASQTAGFLASHPNSDAASAMVKGMAVGKANQAIQEWMNQFGTAQVQIGVDENFSLKHSSASLLHPWYDNPKNLVFSQTGIHRTDDRTQANAGVGYRHFRDHDMFGVNTFLDYDLSRDHARAGLGAEYWRDNLKLGANAYIGLTRWRNSPDVEDYDERPASGWDVRAEGYLPSYPQLGAKLMYEQYYGNEVALFGKDNRQKNPRAVTVGLNWTPVPLLTLGAEQRTGQDGKHETELKAELNWRMGESLSRQLDPAAVAASRSLAGSRYDLIDRNNNIILEYRKQEVIRLRMPARIEGKAMQVIPLTLNVESKYGLKDIVWDDSALVAAGGGITGKGTQWQLTLPDGKTGAHSWMVSAIAYDVKGNASKRQEMQITVTATGISTTASTVIADTDTLLADGISSTRITAVLKKEDGTPATGLAKELNMDVQPQNSVAGKQLASAAGSTRGITLTVFSEVAPGQYESTLTAGNTAGQYSLVLRYGSTPIASTNIMMSPSAMNITVLRDNATADNTDTVILHVEATSAAGKTVHVKTDSAELKTIDGNDLYTMNQEGETDIALKTTKAGDYTIQLSLSPDTGAGSTIDVPVHFVAGAVDPANSEVQIPVAAASQGTQLETRVYLRDKFRNHVMTAQVSDLKVLYSDGNISDTMTDIPASSGEAYISIKSEPTIYNDAVRTNTVSIRVNGVMLAQNQKLAWAPDIIVTNKDVESSMSGLLYMTNYSSGEITFDAGIIKDDLFVSAFGKEYIANSHINTGTVIGKDKISGAEIHLNIPTWHVVPSVNATVDTEMVRVPKMSSGEDKTLSTRPLKDSELYMTKESLDNKGPVKVALFVPDYTITWEVYAVGANNQRVTMNTFSYSYTDGSIIGNVTDWVRGKALTQNEANVMATGKVYKFIPANGNSQRATINGVAGTLVDYDDVDRMKTVEQKNCCTLSPSTTTKNVLWADSYAYDIHIKATGTR